MKDHKCLSSYVVFKELYSKNKDVYEVISIFLKELIIEKEIHNFNLAEITSWLNERYNFDLPSAVIKTSLKRLYFIEKSYGTYNLKEKIESDNKVQEIDDTASFDTNTVYEQLIIFIEEKTKTILNDKEKINLSDSLCNYLLYNHDGFIYSDYISAFIILHEDDDGFKKNLNDIKEGIVLYSGLKYTDPQLIGNWSNELTIYLDTEILFHLAGYNGEIFKKKATTMFRYINEICRKSEKIHLRYFKEVENEIDTYFYVAENIKRGQRFLKPNNSAMSAIVNGAKDISDIATRRSDFYQLLKANRIFKDDYIEYFSEHNFKYNIIDLKTIEEIEKENDKNDIRDNVRFINYINILRKGKSIQKFEDSKYILLTGNSTTLKISLDRKHFRDKRNIPLATDIDFLVNKLWFKLSKGFGNEHKPYTIDIITKAKVTLSSHLSDSLSGKYDEVTKEYKENRITKDTLLNRVHDLRMKTKSPEILSEDNAENVLIDITEDSLEKFLLEQEYFKQEAQKNEAQSKDLKGTVSKLKEEMKKTKILAIRDKEKLLEKLNDNLDVIVRNREESDLKIGSVYRLYKFGFITLLIFVYIISILLVRKIGWNDIEMYTYLISMLSPLLMIIYFVVKEKSLNPKYLIAKTKNKLQERIYKRNRYREIDERNNRTDIQLLVEEIELLKFEV